jgi:hypothetical protein
MAAYDLNVQKPASLAVPNSPGAADLARFLSVSESTRANQEREKLNQNMFDWEKGAGGRALTAAESERERVRQENIAFGNAEKDSINNFLNTSKENFRLNDDVVANFRKQNPNATEDQVDAVRKSVRDKITKDPNAFIDPTVMARQVRYDMMKAGNSSEQAASSRDAVGSYFKAQPEPNENIMKAYLDTILTGGTTDNMGKFSTNRGSNSGGQGTFGTKGSSGYRSEAEFVKETQMGVDALFREGSRGPLSWNLPGTNHEIYKEDLTAAGLLAQTQQGIKPQYFNAVVLGMSQNGRLPNGQDTKDLKDSKSALFETITANAKILQQQAESGGSGAGSNGDLSLSDWRELSQGDMQMKFEAIGRVSELYRKQGGVLTSEEQSQLINDPKLLEEFGIALQESVQKQPGGGNQAPAAAVPAPVPVPQAGANNPAPAPKMRVDEGDNPELDALIRGEERPGRGNPPASSTEDNIKALKLELSKTPTGSEARNLENSGRPPSKVAAELSALETKSIQDQIEAIEEQLSNPAIGSDSTKLFAELKTLNDKQDSKYVKSTKESVSLLTPGYLKNAIPDEFYRSRAQAIVNTIKSGSASDKEVLELKTLFKKFGGPNPTPQPMLTSNTPVPSSQKAGPTGNSLSLEEMAYEPNPSEIYSQADGSEQIGLNRSMLKNNFPDEFLSEIKNSIPSGPNQNKALNLFDIIDSGRGTDKQVEELMAMLSLPKR